MTWRTRQRLRHFGRTSMWVGPTLGALCAIAFHWAAMSLDEHFPTPTDLSVESARTVISLLASAMLSLIVFVLTGLLVVVQLASQTLTPRIIARSLQAPGVQMSLAVFLFEFTFSLGVLTRMDKHVPLIAGRVAVWGSLVCICALMYLVDRFAKALRPISVLTSVASEGADVVRSVYPQTLEERAESNETFPLPAQPAQRVPYQGRSGVLLAFDAKGLVRLASAAGALVELVPEVGDFVVRGDVLFRVYHQPVDERALLACVELGAERTMTQDPAFCLRIIVDIANKALSPAINDPTTGVLALDQVHLLLRLIGLRYLETGRVRDASGQHRLIYSTPGWDDFVTLGLTEIRQYGATSLQVVRRMKALLEHLLSVLPEVRHPLLLDEMKALCETAERSFSDPRDVKLALRADMQGVGGSMPDVSRR